MLNFFSGEAVTKNGHENILEFKEYIDSVKCFLAEKFKTKTGKHLKLQDKNISLIIYL